MASAPSRRRRRGESRPSSGFGQKFVQLVGGEAEADCLPGELAQFVDEALAMDGELPAFARAATKVPWPCRISSRPSPHSRS